MIQRQQLEVRKLEVFDGKTIIAHIRAHAPGFACPRARTYEIYECREASCAVQGLQ